MSIVAFLEELRRDRKNREEFISEIMPDIMMRLALDKDLRVSLLRAIAGEVATKEDLRELEKRLREDMRELEGRLKEYIDKRVDEVNRRVDDLIRRVDERIDDLNKTLRVTLIAILMTLLATIVVPLILRALGVIT